MNNKEFNVTNLIKLAHKELRNSSFDNHENYNYENFVNLSISGVCLDNKDNNDHKSITCTCDYYENEISLTLSTNSIFVRISVSNDHCILRVCGLGCDFERTYEQRYSLMFSKLIFAAIFDFVDANFLVKISQISKKFENSEKFEPKWDSDFYQEILKSFKNMSLR